jgi:hypothetical protein
MPQTRREDRERGEFFLLTLQIAGAGMVPPACLGMQNHTRNKKIND